MSRTVREHLDGEYIIRGEIIHWNDPRIDGIYPRYLGWKYRERIIEQRDNKPWNKPPKWFKQMRRRQERAAEMNALRNGKEIPKFKKDDQWNWT